MGKGPWIQELLWVSRNENGVITGIRKTLRDEDEFIPTLPKSEKSK